MGLPEGIPGDGRARIPASTVRAAAIAGGVVGAIVTCAVLAHGVSKGKVEWLEDLAIGAFVAGALFLFILLALSLMRSGGDWRKRGGRPDPFTRA